MKGISKGSVAIEFMILAPILIILLFGIIQVSSLFYVRAQLLNVAYNSARIAATNPNATNATVQAYITQQLSRLGVTAASTLVPADLTAAERGTPLTVTISADANSLVLLPIPIRFGGVTVSVSSSMAKEF